MSATGSVLIFAITLGFESAFIDAIIASDRLTLQGHHEGLYF